MLDVETDTNINNLTNNNNNNNIVARNFQMIISSKLNTNNLLQK